MKIRRPVLAVAMAMLWLAALYRGLVRDWMYTWGAATEEFVAVLPGDELVQPGVPRTTRAITIRAPAKDVWPWLAQIGEDRGGFYSYSLLERAVGARIHNAMSVHPEWQDIQVGDEVWLARHFGSSACQIVVAVVPGSHLVLVSPSDFDRTERGERASGSWAFYLNSVGDTTRLLVRGSGGAVGHAAFDVPHFVMEQKMLRGIRDRAEAAATRRSTTTDPRGSRPSRRSWQQVT